MLYIEMQYSVKRALHTRFPALSRTDMAIVHSFDRNDLDIFRLRIYAVGTSRMLINLKCGADGADQNFTRKFADNFLGSTVCVAQFFDNSRHVASRRRPSNVFLVICLCLTYKSADVDDFGLQGRLDNVFLRLCGNRKDIERWGPVCGDSIRLFPITTCVAHQRMFKACHMTSYMHPVVRASFFGKELPQEGGRLIGSTASRERTISENTWNRLRARVDKGCLKYLDSIPDNEPNRCQKMAIMQH